MSWYLIASKPKQEGRAVENLINQSVNVFLPTINVESCTRGKVVSREEPLFPGYLFIELEEDDPLWSKIRSTRGVRDFVKFGGRPALVPEIIVKSLQEADVSANESIVSNLPKEGDLVLIKDGPFHELQAIFKMRDGTHRAIVLLNILGKNQQLSVDLHNLARL